MKVLTVVGARPQFVKAAVVSRALAASNDAREILVHTGQHYDAKMSGMFFDELGLPVPKYHLGVGSGKHGEQTGKMLVGIEAAITAESPDVVLVYGDTNSTLAGALAAVKLQVPVAHVEAGLRSFNRAMPEEINRVVTDHCSEILLCPSKAAVENLAREGIHRGVHHVGDVMYDAALCFGALADSRGSVLKELGLERGYYLATVHRAESTDEEERLRGILSGLAQLAEIADVVLPLHPRTAKAVEGFGFRKLLGNVRVIDPVSFIDMICLERGAKVILTDSGGVQKEAYFHRVPCVTMRDETEWIETVESGWNVLAGASASKIVEGAMDRKPGLPISDYGDGNSAKKLVAVLREELVGGAL